jgi:hypothetical protein
MPVACGGCLRNEKSDCRLSRSIESEAKRKEGRNIEGRAKEMIVNIVITCA